MSARRCPRTRCTAANPRSQDDKEEKLKGVRSLIKYATLSDYMLVPTEESALTGDAAKFPEGIPGYGKRGWCRCEFFIFSHLSFTSACTRPFSCAASRSRMSSVFTDVAVASSASRCATCVTLRAVCHPHTRQ